MKSFIRKILSGTFLRPALSTMQSTLFFTSSQTSPSLPIRSHITITNSSISTIIISIIYNDHHHCWFSIIIINTRTVTTTTSPLQCLFCHWLAVVLCSTTMVIIIDEDDNDDCIGDDDIDDVFVMNVDDYQYNPKSVWRRFWTEYSSHYGPWCSRLTLFSGSRDFYSLALCLKKNSSNQNVFWNDKKNQL